MIISLYINPHVVQFKYLELLLKNKEALELASFSISTNSVPHSVSTLDNLLSLLSLSSLIGKSEAETSHILLAKVAGDDVDQWHRIINVHWGIFSISVGINISTGFTCF